LNLLHSLLTGHDAVMFSHVNVLSYVNLQGKLCASKEMNEFH